MEVEKAEALFLSLHLKSHNTHFFWILLNSFSFFNMKVVYFRLNNREICFLRDSLLLEYLQNSE